MLSRWVMWTATVMWTWWLAIVGKRTRCISMTGMWLLLTRWGRDLPSVRTRMIPDPLPWAMWMATALSMSWLLIIIRRTRCISMMGMRPLLTRWVLGLRWERTRMPLPPFCWVMWTVMVMWTWWPGITYRRTRCTSMMGMRLLLTRWGRVLRWVRTRIIPMLFRWVMWTVTGISM